LDQKKKFQFSEEQVGELDERRSNAIASPDTALRQLYAELRFPVPDREGEAGTGYEPVTAGTVEVLVEPQAQATADFGVWAEEPKPGVYRLRVRADKAQTFIVFRVLQNLSDKAERLTVTFDIEAEAKDLRPRLAAQRRRGAVGGSGRGMGVTDQGQRKEGKMDRRQMMAAEIFGTATFRF